MNKIKGLPAAEYCYAEGPGILPTAGTKEMQNFYIVAIDKFQKQKVSGGDKFVVQIEFMEQAFEVNSTMGMKKKKKEKKKKRKKFKTNYCN